MLRSSDDREKTGWQIESFNDGMNMWVPEGSTVRDFEESLRLMLYFKEVYAHTKAYVNMNFHWRIRNVVTQEIIPDALF